MATMPANVSTLPEMRAYISGAVSEPSRPASCIDVASTPVTVPSQRVGLTWMRNACLAG